MIVAPTCPVCGALLDRPTAGPVCEACWSAVRPFTPPLCPVCGDPLPAGRLSAAAENASNAAQHIAEVAGWIAAATIGGAEVAPPPFSLCPRCRHAPSLIARSRAVGEYAGTLRTIVHVLKYDKRCSVAPRLAASMRTHGADVVRGADAATPVPLHWKRKWQRGFNQAAELAAGLGLPVWPALARVRATSPQVDLPARARRTNVRDAFAVARPRWPWQVPWAANLKGTVIVLVDDVSTTGSTLEACAQVLREAGVVEVRALTAARVVDPSPHDRPTRR